MAKEKEKTYRVRAVNPAQPPDVPNTPGRHRIILDDEPLGDVILEPEGWYARKGPYNSSSAAAEVLVKLKARLLK